MNVASWFPWHPTVWRTLPPHRWQQLLEISTETPLAGTATYGGITWTLAGAEAWRPPAAAPPTARWVVLAPGNEARLAPPPGWRQETAREILCWERRPERGVLHDPPLRWKPIALDAYWSLRQETPRDLPWPRRAETLGRLQQALPVRAHAVQDPASGAALAILWWSLADHLVHIVDVCWSNGATVRQLGRYLLQDLYLRHPKAHVILEFEPVASPLSPVLMALGYRVYRRWWEYRWERSG